MPTGRTDGQEAAGHDGLGLSLLVSVPCRQVTGRIWSAAAIAGWRKVTGGPGRRAWRLAQPAVGLACGTASPSYALTEPLTAAAYCLAAIGQRLTEQGVIAMAMSASTAGRAPSAAVIASRTPHPPRARSSHRSCPAPAATSPYAGPHRESRPARGAAARQPPPPVRPAPGHSGWPGRTSTSPPHMRRARSPCTHWGHLVVRGLAQRPGILPGHARRRVPVLGNPVSSTTSASTG